MHRQDRISRLPDDRPEHGVLVVIVSAFAASQR
jgi:hypothetical protein